MKERCPVVGKVIFKTETEVQTWLANYRRRKTPRMRRMRAYKCPHCQMWHLTKWQKRPQ